MSLTELVYALLIFLIATGVGRKGLRLLGCSASSYAEELCFSLGLGLAAIALSVVFLGFAHLLYEGYFYILMALWGGLGARSITGLREVVLGQARRLRFDWRNFHTYLTLLLLVGISLNLVHALSPVHGAVDPLAYHLALPKIYLEKHYLSFERTIRGSMYPANFEMLFCLAIGLRSGILAQLLHFGLGVASAAAILIFGNRYFDWQTGLWAAVIFYFMPVMIFFSSFGYVDVGLCFFQILGTWALFNWLGNPTRPGLLIAALFMGFALGIKHNAIFLGLTGGLVVAVGAYLEERRLVPAARRAAVYAVVMLSTASPWYIRSYVETGNPVWPFANDFFKGLPATQVEAVVNDTPSAAEETAPAASRWTVPAILEIPQYPFIFLWRWAFSEAPGSQRATGIYLVALLPGLLLYLKNRRLRLLAAFCFFFTVIVVLFIHANPRYSLFEFGFLSVLAGYVSSRASTRVVRYVRNGVLLSVVLYDLVWIYQFASPGIKVVLGEETRDYFLTQNEPSYRVSKYVNTVLPRSAVVLLQGDVRGYYFNRPYLWDHPDQAVLVYGQLKTPADLFNQMKKLGITHIVRLIRMPAIRRGMYPEYFTDPLHVSFTSSYLKLLYVDETYALFEIKYGNS